MALRAASVAPLDTGFLATVRDVLRSVGLTDEPPAAGGALRDAWEARAALLRLAEEAPEGTDLRSFTDDLQARAKDQHEPATRTVTLATLHAAKGLEWDHVHLVGVSEGLLPISYAQTFEAVDEERRLAYVGVTRAARTLSVSWSRGRGRSERTPSRFLREIGSGSLRSADAFARPLERVDAQVQRARHGVDPTAEQMTCGPGRLGGEGDVDLGSRAREELRGDKGPGRVLASACGVQTAQACRRSGRDHGADGRGGAVEDEREVHDVVAHQVDRASRVDPVRSEEKHLGNRAVRGGSPATGPVTRDVRAGRAASTARTVAAGEVIGHLERDRRRPPLPHERRRELRHEVVAVAVAAAVHTDQRPKR